MMRRSNFEEDEGEVKKDDAVSNDAWIGRSCGTVID